MRVQTPVLLLGTVLLTTLAAPKAPVPAATGTVSGTVTFTGTPPKMKPIDMSKEPTCASQHATPVMTESAVTGPGNTLQWVVVYVSAGEENETPANETVRYDQKGCQYSPHVAVMEVNQTLEIYNDDPTSHNIHPLATVNAEWNKAQPSGAPPIRTTYGKPEFIPVKCNVHAWMHGYFAVLSTAHHAVSGADGKFSLAGLAPGKYTITAWHEKFGTQTRDVTITGSETATVNFVFKAMPY